MNPFSLQAAAPPNRGPQSIADFIRRVNAEPGGFRALNHDELIKQIEAAKHKSEVDIEMEDVDDADESSATPSKDPIAARDELIRNINAAQRTATTTLDLISLLLSKETPNQVTATLNPELRNLVGIGTLGATVLAGPTSLTRNRIPDNKLVSIGMRLQAVNKAADFLESTARRLESEISLETTYWNEVREASERGWSVFRHPDQPNTMGVKFGFSRAAPDFKANSIAPMRRAEDGTVRLEHGKMTAVSKRIQVTISQGDKVVGQSRLSPPLQDDVKEARDTVFAQELWYELNREGRTLLAHRVYLREDAVTYTDETDRTISFRLVTLDDDVIPTTPLPEDGEAERINDILHLLLIHAHRQNEIRRSEQSGPGPNRGPPPVYSLLQPVITSHVHELAVQECVTFLTTLCHTLGVAGLTPAPSFTLAELARPVSSTESLADSLQNPPVAELDLTITPATRLRITARASPTSATRFGIFLLPSAGSEGDVRMNPLFRSYPPGPRYDPTRPGVLNLNEAPFDSANKLFQYLSGAVPRALASHFHAALARDDSTGAKWIIDAFGTAVVDDNGAAGIRFDFGKHEALSEESEVAVTWADVQLTATANFVQEANLAQRICTWSRDSKAEGTLEDVVRFVAANRTAVHG